MHPFFSVTLFTGQQLVLEAIQRWLQRPCADEASARARRLGLKGLISLLLRTAATGVLATVLDAAIEFRRRQLLAAAAAGPEDADGAPPGGRFPGLGMLSRAGVAAWKARLLRGIDELERRAEAYGIESRRRFSPSKDEAEAAPGGKPSSSFAAGRGGSRSLADMAGGEEEQSQRLGRTVEQLRELVQQGDAESERRLDEEVGSLVDLILGTLPAPPAAPAGAASRSRSVPAGLDLWQGGGMRASRSRAALAAATAPGSPRENGGQEPASPGGGSPAGQHDPCAICMDRCVRVQVAGCQHSLCFGCARRLCAMQDHSVPQCPFCRQPIEGFVALASGRLCDGSGAGAESAGAALAGPEAAALPAC